MGEVKTHTISGVKWTAIEKFSIQGVTFILGLIVARLLTPADYGLIGMVGIFFAVSYTLIDSGFGNALVRKQDRTETDYYTVFYFCLAASIICSLILCVIADWIADFFNQPLLSPIVKVMSFNMVITNLGIIPAQKLYISLDFKTTAKINFICATISGIFGLILAWQGFGVWTIVWEGVFCNILRVILLWTYKPCKILFEFSISSFKQMFNYGSKLALSGLLHTVYSEITTIAIGKFYSPASLGNYSRGTSTASLPVGIITGIVGKVTFPILAKIQNDDNRLIGVYRSYISLVMMFVVFGCVMMAAMAKPLILFLLTDKWEGAIIFIQIFAFAIMFDPICSLNLNLLQVKGRSDLFLRLEIIKKAIAMAILFAAIPWGVVAICIAKVIYTQIAVCINTYYTGKLFGLGYWQQLRDFTPYIFYSLVAALPSILLSIYCPFHLISLIIGFLLGTIIYLYLLRRTNDSLFMEHINPILSRFLKKFELSWLSI